MLTESRLLLSVQTTVTIEEFIEVSLVSFYELSCKLIPVTFSWLGPWHPLRLHSARIPFLVIWKWGQVLELRSRK